MNEAEIKRIVHQVLQDERERAAENFDAVVLRTISAILTSFGINDDEKKEIRADFSHLRRWRKASERVGNAGLAAAIGVVVVGFFGMFWAGFGRALLGK